MDRSPGFGSTNADFRFHLRNPRPFQTRFPFASLFQVKLANASNSLTHYTKGTQSLDLHLAPTACTHLVSGSISLPSPGCFSPFPHGTCSLSVSKEYLALEDGPPIFNQDFSCPDLLIGLVLVSSFNLQGFHLLRLTFPSHSIHLLASDIQALSLSLAATRDISVDFFSSRY